MKYLYRNKITASAGDMTLYKFLFIPIDKIDGLEEKYYDERLNGYLYLWEYHYNTITKDTDDRGYAHADMIDSLNFDMKKLYRQYGVWGRTDYTKYSSNPIFYCNNEDPLTENQLSTLKRYCRTV